MEVSAEVICALIAGGCTVLAERRSLFSRTGDDLLLPRYGKLT